MLIFLLCTFLLTNNTIINGFGYSQRRPVAQQTVAAPAQPAAPVTPTFTQLQAEFEEQTSGPSEMGNTVLKGLASFYANITQLLAQQRSADWKGYFSSSAGANALGSLSSRVQEANALISALSTQKPTTASGTITPLDTVEQRQRKSKAIEKYSSATRDFSNIAQEIGIQGQLPLVTPATPPANSTTTTGQSQQAAATKMALSAAP
ncbi:MAG: hypothetical protein QG632_196, partial [Candidatus Dependentiae bacterium]|nr:hypothetical protein [Candidatus Dependentiae bacterium]